MRVRYFHMVQKSGLDQEHSRHFPLQSGPKEKSDV